MSCGSRTRNTPATPLRRSCSGYAVAKRRCDATTSPGRIRRRSFSKPRYFWMFSSEMVGRSFRYIRGCRQRARSRRCVPAFGMLTQNTRGAERSVARRASFDGVSPNRSNVQRSRGTESLRPMMSSGAVSRSRAAPRPRDDLPQTTRIRVGEMAPRLIPRVPPSEPFEVRLEAGIGVDESLEPLRCGRVELLVEAVPLLDQLDRRRRDLVAGRLPFRHVRAHVEKVRPSVRPLEHEQEVVEALREPDDRKM